MTDEPAPTRQYLAIRFRPGDHRQYTYHCDGDRCEVGEFIKIPARDGGWVKAEVIGVDLEKPAFETKAIIGKFPPPAPRENTEKTDG